MAEREESRKGGPEFDTTLKASALWNCGLSAMSGWTGLNPSGVTLIKFKTYSQQSGDYSSFSFWGTLGPSLKEIKSTLEHSLCSNLGTTSFFAREQGPFNSGLCIHLYISKCLENS